MTKVNLGILGGGQLGSLLAISAKKLNIKTTIFCDDKNAPAQNYCDNFIFGDYEDSECIKQFINNVDLVTYEFENIPYETLHRINSQKKVHPKPEINKIIQNNINYTIQFAYSKKKPSLSNSFFDSRKMKF